MTNQNGSGPIGTFVSSPTPSLVPITFGSGTLTLAGSLGNSITTTTNTITISSGGISGSSLIWNGNSFGWSNEFQKARDQLNELGVSTNPIDLLKFFEDEEKVMAVVRRLKLKAFE